MKELILENLSVKYNYGALAVAKLSLYAKKGSVYTVFGGTESGKTSFLKCLAGIIPSIEGKIFADGKDITKNSVRDRNVCLVYEDGCFFENKSARYNIEYPMKIRKLSQADMEAKVFEAVRNIGFDEKKLSVKVKKLNATDRFLLSLARAYGRQADLYLFDDPLKELGEDRKIYFPMLYEFMKKKAMDGVTVYATTDATECRIINTECIVLNYGICLQSGKVCDIVNNPRSVGVLRSFCPKEELYDGTIVAEEEKIYLVSQGKRELNRAKLISDIFIGKECIVHNRGDKVALYDKRSEKLIYFD